MNISMQMERELDANRNEEYGSDTVFDVKWSNAVRRAVRGLEQPTGLWTFDMNVAQLQRVVGELKYFLPLHIISFLRVSINVFSGRSLLNFFF